MYCHMLLKSSQLYLTTKSLLSRTVVTAEMLGVFWHYRLQFLTTEELVFFPQPVNMYYSASNFLSNSQIRGRFFFLSSHNLQTFTTTLSYSGCIEICRVVKLHAWSFRWFWNFLCRTVARFPLLSAFFSVCCWLRSFPKVIETLFH